MRNQTERKGLLALCGKTLRRQQLTRRRNVFSSEVSRAFCCNYGVQAWSLLEWRLRILHRQRVTSGRLCSEGLAAKLTCFRASRARPAKQTCANGTGSNSALGCIMEFNRWNVAAGGGDEKRGGKGRAGLMPEEWRQQRTSSLRDERV